VEVEGRVTKAVKGAVEAVEEVEEGVVEEEAAEAGRGVGGVEAGVC